METTTPFDLNKAIQRWRENLDQSPAFRRENLDELESHLRDTVATLQTRGLSAEEALLIGVKRMGRNASLETEFGKVNGKAIWLDRTLWMLVGIQCWGLVHGFTNTLLRSTVFFGLINYDFLTYGRTIPALLFLLANLLGFAASVMGCWWLFSRHGSTIGGWASGCLSRRSTWQLVFVGAALLWVFSFWLNFGITLLQTKLVAVTKLGEIASSQSYTWIAGSLVQALTFLILTIVIARKRLVKIKA